MVTIPHSYFNLLFFILLIPSISPLIPNWNYAQSGNDWPSTCNEGNQSPINISPPFTYKPNPLKIFYQRTVGESFISHNKNNLRIEGDFGYIQYNNENYASSEIIFYQPSLHSFKDKKYSMEMEVINKNSKGEEVILCVLFDSSKEEYSPLLGSMGFDNEELKSMDALIKNKIEESINLSEIFSNEKDYFYYEGLSPIPPCVTKSTFFLISDILYANEEQLKNFPKILKDKFRKIQGRNERNIFITVPLNKLDEHILLSQQEQKKQMEEEKKAEEISNKVDKNKIKEEIQIDQLEIIKQKENELNSDNSLEINTPTEEVKKRLKLLKKYNKITEINLLKDSSQKESMIIDRDIPKTKKEMESIYLKKKFEEWIDLYTKYKNGENILEEQERIFTLYKMSLLQKELFKKKYKPFINYYNNLLNPPTYEDYERSQKYFSAFIETETKENISSDDDISLYSLSEDAKKYLEYSININDLNSPYKPLISLEEEINLSNGRIPISELNLLNNDIFDSSSFGTDCRRAQYNSPININLNHLKNAKKIKRNDLKLNIEGPSSDIKINNDNYKIVISASKGFGSVSFKDHSYKVKKYLIHSPSEHTLGEKEERTQIEIQMICSDTLNNTLGVAFLLEEGNKELEFFNGIGMNTKKKENFLMSKKIRNNEAIEIKLTEYIKDSLNLGKIINEDKKLKYVSYIGSTTTPPCKTNVRWFICLDKIKISKAQIEMFPV
ncbi:MAG: carbonic anhydrase family protein, partial [archaeon]|nr:carbonic anhydrase family protein [archaeon]